MTLNYVVVINFCLTLTKKIIVLLFSVSAKNGAGQ